MSLQPGVIACDVARFVELLADGSRDAPDAAASLYGGHLLADMEIEEEAWTEWLGAQRQRLEGLALDAMVRLGDQELEAGNHESAFSAANRVMAISGLREDAHRLIMRVLAAGGRRADALKHYEDLTALLKRELAVEPDPATRALAAELRKSNAAWPGSGVRSDPASETGVVLLPLPDRPSIAVLPFANMSGDRPLSGASSYRLKLPPHIPAANFWSVTLYDAENASGLANGQPFPSLGSRDSPTLFPHSRFFSVGSRTSEAV